MFGLPPAPVLVFLRNSIVAGMQLSSKGPVCPSSQPRSLSTGHMKGMGIHGGLHFHLTPLRGNCWQLVMPRETLKVTWLKMAKPLSPWVLERLCGGETPLTKNSHLRLRKRETSFWSETVQLANALHNKSTRLKQGLQILSNPFLYVIKPNQPNPASLTQVKSTYQIGCL